LGECKNGKGGQRGPRGPPNRKAHRLSKEYRSTQTPSKDPVGGTCITRKTPDRGGKEQTSSEEGGDNRARTKRKEPGLAEKHNEKRRGRSVHEVSPDNMRGKGVGHQRRTGVSGGRSCAKFGTNLKQFQAPAGKWGGENKKKGGPPEKKQTRAQVRWGEKKQQKSGRVWPVDSGLERNKWIWDTRNKGMYNVNPEGPGLKCEKRKKTPGPGIYKKGLRRKKKLQHWALARWRLK